MNAPGASPVGVEPPLDGPNLSPEPAAAPRSRRRVLLRVVQLLFIVAIAYFLVSYLRRSWGSIAGYHWSLDLFWMGVSALAFLVFYVLQAVAWWLILRGFSLRCGLVEMSSIWAQSIVARYIPGNVFMFVGRAWMCRQKGMKVDKVSAAMIYEQALGLCSALVAVAVLFPFWETKTGAMALSLLAIPVLIALLHPRVFLPLARWGLRLLRREPLEVTLSFGRVLALLAFFSATWLVAGLGAWSLARAVAGLGPGAFPLVTVAYAFAYVVGMAAFIFPSGIGVREAVLTASLTARHLPGGVVLAWSLLLRLWVTAVELLFIGLAVATGWVARRRGAAS